MGFVEKFNFFGTEAIQIPCINGEGAPTTKTEGAVGCLYMDTLTGEIYKCTEVSGSVYTWERFRGAKDVIIRSDKKIYVQDAVYSSLIELAKATGCDTEDLHKYYTFYYENVFKNTDGTITYTEYVPLSATVCYRNYYLLNGYGHQRINSTMVKNRYIAITQTSSIQSFQVIVRTRNDYAVTATAELDKARRYLIVKQDSKQVAKVEAAGELTGNDKLSWLFTDYSGSSTIDGDYSASFGFANKSTGNGNVIGGLYNNVVGRALGVFGGANMVKKCAIGAIIGGRHAGVNDDTVVFAIGNGTSDSTQSLAHTLDLAGNAWFAGAVQSTGADYAEYFEWADENPNKEDRTGLFVALEGDKAVIANETSDIIGVVSAAPAIIGDSYERQWKGMYVTDIYGRVVYEDVEVEKEYTTFDDEGNEVTTTQTVTEHRPKLNPDYDAAKEYIPRSKRPEWATVGFLGKLVVMDDGTCVVGSRCSCGKDGIATDGTAYRVLKRMDESHVMILASFL